jgi:hypothetical protein
MIMTMVMRRLSSGASPATQVEKTMDMTTIMKMVMRRLSSDAYPATQVGKTSGLT